MPPLDRHHCAPCDDSLALTQDISARFASLIYGATSVFAVLTGAAGQYFTGWLLDQNGRDFTPMFALVVVVELAGLVAWNAWWDSERTFD